MRAELLKRVYDVDALACPCGGRLKFVELLTDVQAAREILQRLALDPEPPNFPRADIHPVDLDQRPPDWDP